VLSRYSTLAWLMNLKRFQGRLGRWAALLSEWTLEVRKCTKGEEPSSKTTPASQPTSKKKSKAARKKLKAPESEGEEVADRRAWTEEELAAAFYQKDLFRFLAENGSAK
jgi:hypothetical protein